MRARARMLLRMRADVVEAHADNSETVSSMM